MLILNSFSCNSYRVRYMQLVKTQYFNILTYSTGSRTPSKMPRSLEATFSGIVLVSWWWLWSTTMIWFCVPGMISTRRIPSRGQVPLTCSKHVAGVPENLTWIYARMKKATIAWNNMNSFWDSAINTFKNLNSVQTLIKFPFLVDELDTRLGR